MKLLKCLLCNGEVDIINHERSINKQVKCQKCHYSNDAAQTRKTPEILFIRKKIVQD
jgi:hypothetical protein